MSHPRVDLQFVHDSIKSPPLKLPEGITIGASSGTSGPQEELGIDATMAFDRRRAQPSVPE